MTYKTIEQAVMDRELEVGTWFCANYGFGDHLFCVYEIDLTEGLTITAGNPEWLSSFTLDFSGYKNITVLGTSKKRKYWAFLPKFLRDTVFPFPKLSSRKKKWWL